METCKEDAVEAEIVAHFMMIEAVKKMERVQAVCNSMDADDGKKLAAMKEYVESQWKLVEKDEKEKTAVELPKWKDGQGSGGMSYRTEVQPFQWKCNNVHC